MDYGKPASYLTLAEGVDVVSSDGERVGALEHVLGDEETDIFDGIVIDIQTGPGGHRFVDAPQVAECFERAVVISIPADQIGELPQPSPSPAVMEHHGVEDSEGELREKLRRAWDMISGNRG